MYILCSGKKGTLYVGVTNNLRLRIWQHKTKSISGFTTKYNINRLVHVEEFQNVHEALHREKCIKKWNRQWKLRLIEENNPDWMDFYDTIV